MKFVQHNEQALRVLANLSAMAAAEIQEDWHGFEVLRDAVPDADVNLYGQAAAMVLLDAVEGYSGELADGGRFDSVDRHLRAAAVAFAKGNSERAYLLVRGRFGVPSAVKAVAEAWMVDAGGDRQRAAARARQACSAYQAYALTVS